MYPKKFGYPTYVGDYDTEKEDICDLEQRIRKMKDKIINSMTEEQLADYTELLVLEAQYLKRKRKGVTL